MFRSTAVLLSLALITCSPALAQKADAPPAGAQPPRAQTPQDLIKAAEQLVPRIHEANQTGGSAEVTRVAGDAQRALENIIRTDPKNVDAHVVLGELLTEMRDLNAARKHFKLALDEEASNFRANLGLGRFYLESHLWRQAGGYLQTAARVAPTARQAETLRLLASSFLGEGKRLEAATAAEQAVKADPQDIDSLFLLIQIYLDTEQVEKALDRAHTLVEACRQMRETKMADTAALEQLINAYQYQIKCLASFYGSLCKRDARGRRTEQIEPGKEADAVRVLSEIAAASEDVAKLNWELSYHQTLRVLEPVAACQKDETRERLESNTRYLLDMAGLYWATHQSDKAIETFQRLESLTKPSDLNPADAKRNQDAAREFLQQHGLPVAPPAGQ